MKQMILLYKFLFLYFCFYPSLVGMYVNTCTEVALASGPANFYQSIWRSLPAHTSERTDSSLDIDSSRVLLTGYRYKRKMSVPHPLVLTGNIPWKFREAVNHENTQNATLTDLRWAQKKKPTSTIYRRSSWKISTGKNCLK